MKSIAKSKIFDTLYNFVVYVSVRGWALYSIRYTGSYARRNTERLHEGSKSTLLELLHTTVSKVAKDAKHYLADMTDDESSHLETLADLKKALKMSVFLLQGFIVKEEGVLTKKAVKGHTVGT